MLVPHLGLDLRTLLYPEPNHAEEAARQLAQTAITQPALFVIEYALAQLWMSWGVQPAAMIGHSIGEYVGACISGVFTLADALRLVPERGRLMQAQPAGSMLAVRMAEKDLQELFSGPLSIAAVNAPGSCVASGPAASIEALKQSLMEKGIAATQLQTSHAFHSAMMEDVRAPFMELSGRLNRKEPQIPFISNVTGKWITPREATDPTYWARHLRETVRFADGVGELLKNPDYVFLEVGPGHTLSQFAKQNPARRPNTAVVSSLGSVKNAVPSDTSLVMALGQLWLNGVEIDWSAFHADVRRQRVSLPTYPFERTRYWVEPGCLQARAVASNGNAETPVEVQSDSHKSPDGVEAQSRAEETRKDRIIRRLRTMLAELSGMNFNALESRTTFMELGFESLFLTQTSVAIEKTFGVRIAFRQLIENVNSLSNLADYLESRLPEDESLWEKAREIDGARAGDGLSLPTLELTFSGRSRIEEQGDSHSRISFGSELSGPEKEIPVTESQRELWFASQISEAASCAFNECRLLHFRGTLDRGVLMAALQKLVERHDSLRTTFAVTGDVQRVSAHLNLDVPTSEFGAEECPNRVDEVKRAEAGRAFDLINGPLFRAQLLVFGPEHHVLVLTAHHLVCDGSRSELCCANWRRFIPQKCAVNLPIC
jgi:malonyl CoA-acyl carrier protein transacylase/acyl carrier protein